MKRLLIAFTIFAAVQIWAQTPSIIGDDDFSNAAASSAKWEFQHGPEGSFRIADNTALLMCGKAQTGARIFFRNSQGWTDYEVSCRLKFLPSDTNGHAGLFVRRDGDNGINIHLTKNLKFLYVGGKNISPIYKPIKADEGEWQALKIVCKGDIVTVAVNGQEIICLDVKKTSGGICLHTWEANVAFEDFKVTGVNSGKEQETVNNLINNSSFEYMSSPNLPACWGFSAWGLTDDQWIGHMDELWQRWRRDSQNPYDGKYCMKVDGYKVLASTFFTPQENQVYTFSAWLRSSADNGVVTLKFINYNGPTWDKKVTVFKEWQRVVWTLPPVKSNQCGVMFQVNDNNTLWVDAVQLVSGNDPKPYHADRFNPDRKPESSSQVPVINPAVTATAPKMDGSLDDPGWKNAVRLQMVTNNGGNPVEKTEAFLIYDKSNIYVGIRCFDSRMADLKAAVTGRDGHVWNDDCVELFIGPSGPRSDWSDYYHLGINTAGAKYDARKTDQGWNREWQAVTKKFNDRWEATIALPFAMFELNEFNRGDWTFNVCRENPKIKEYSAWSPTYGNFHKSEKFGIIKAFPPDILSGWIKNPVPVLADDFMTTPLLVDGKPFIGYGLGWQSINSPGENAFRMMKESGLNVINWSVKCQSADEKSVHHVFDMAEKYDIKVVVWFTYDNAINPKYPEYVKTFIERYKKHRSIIAWQVLDEPHTYPEIVKQCVDAGKAADPTRPVFINLTPHGLGMRIADIPGDIVSFDTYGVNFDGSVIADLDHIFGQVHKELVMKPRPSWVFLQGMANCMWVWRGPNPDEMTAQVYLSLVNGATGIMFFNAFILPVDTWRRTIELGREIQKLTPVLLSNNDVKVNCSNDRIKYMARKYQGKIYIIAVNPYDKEIAAEFKLAGLSNKITAKELFSSTSGSMDVINMEMIFKPYERRCWEIIIKE
ncbi:MAG: family 16 glycoside hydrolase [Lentisphaerota bacterium]